jgi:predicted DNA-binding transcriptional regulator AlpA
MEHNSKLLTESEAAKFLGISRSTLRQGRMHGYRASRVRTPDFIRSGRMIRYHLDDLNAWIEKHRVNAGSLYQPASSGQTP